MWQGFIDRDFGDSMGGGSRTSARGAVALTLTMPIHLSASPLPCGSWPELTVCLAPCCDKYARMLGVKNSLALSECNRSIGGLEPPVSALSLASKCMFETTPLNMRDTSRA